MTWFRFILIPVVLLFVGALTFRHYLLAVGVFSGLFCIECLGLAFPQLRMFGDYVCRGSKSKMRVALTFDDGPDPRCTPQLLDLLRTERLTVAFFCIGRQVEKNPDLAARIVREGHLLENHSFAHSNFTNFYLSKQLRAELIRTQEAVEKACGVAPRFYRPPIGHSNPSTFRVAHSLNLRVIGWTIRSLDTIIADPSKVVARIKRRLEPGAIILLHDGNVPAEKLLATVKSLLDTLHGLGYQIVRLDELLK